MNSFNQNSKSNVPCGIPTVRKFKEKSDNNKSKNTKNDFFKISPTTKCYKYQDYGHVDANYSNPCKIVINDVVLIEAPKPDSTISPKVAHVIKEFTDTRPLPSPALLSTPPSPPPLLLIPTIVTCFDYQPLPLLLPIPSLFLLGHMLGTKLKFATNLILIANQYQVIEFASSFASHVHENM